MATLPATQTLGGVHQVGRGYEPEERSGPPVLTRLGYTSAGGAPDTRRGTPPWKRR